MFKVEVIVSTLYGVGYFHLHENKATCIVYQRVHGSSRNQLIKFGHFKKQFYVYVYSNRQPVFSFLMMQCPSNPRGIFKTFFFIWRRRKVFLEKKEQFYLYIAQNHNHIASVGLTICTSSVLQSLIRVRKNLSCWEKSATFFSLSVKPNNNYICVYMVLSWQEGFGRL